MKDIVIRTLRADEVECRVQSVTTKGCILLIYKDARVDMRMLDEVFGCMNWQRTHELINGNLFCNIDIWDDDKKVWVRKQDVGVESKTEQQKGEASDSFKRAGFTVGIGRELYSSPFIWVSLSESEITKSGDKCYLAKGVSFNVTEIGYNDNREINKLKIVDSKGAVRYEMGKRTDAPSKQVSEQIIPPKRETPKALPELVQGSKEWGAALKYLISPEYTFDIPTRIANIKKQYILTKESEEKLIFQSEIN